MVIRRKPDWQYLWTWGVSLECKNMGEERGNSGGKEDETKGQFTVK